MNTLFQINNQVIVFLEDGTSMSKEIKEHSEFDEISKHIDDNDWLKEVFNPEYKSRVEKYNYYKKLMEEIRKIPFFSFYKDGSVYWEEVSPHSMPEDLVVSVMNAYNDSDNTALSAYKNFWTLLSLNPDENVRKNLWWFLQLHGLVLSSSGFFIAYRNASSTEEKDSDGNLIFTDYHSHTTKISIGHTVSIPKEDCDTNSENECSKGLHCASLTWLTKNYYGDVGLVVIVNPQKVVAVPHRSEYGKLRTCEYMPIDYAEYDDKGNLIPYDVKMGFECKYATQAIYEGIVNIEKNKYTIRVPEIPTFNQKEKITKNLLNLAKECVANKDFNIVS